MYHAIIKSEMCYYGRSSMDKNEIKKRQKRLTAIAAALGGVIVVLLVVLIIGIIR